MVSSMRALAVLGTALLALTVVSGTMQDTPVPVWGRLHQLLGGRACAFYIAKRYETLGCQGVCLGWCPLLLCAVCLQCGWLSCAHSISAGRAMYVRHVARVSGGGCGAAPARPAALPGHPRLLRSRTCAVLCVGCRRHWTGGVSHLFALNPVAQP